MDIHVRTLHRYILIMTQPLINLCTGLVSEGHVSMYYRQNGIIDNKCYLISIDLPYNTFDMIVCSL